MRLFCTLAWSTWNNQNNNVFQNRGKSLDRILIDALGFIGAFDQVHSGVELPMQTPPCLWSVPLFGWVKTNRDASLRCGNVGVCIGCCARSAYGNLVAARARFLDVSFSGFISRTRSYCYELNANVDFDLPRIIIESDAKGAIDYIYDE